MSARFNAVDTSSDDTEDFLFVLSARRPVDSSSSFFLSRENRKTGDSGSDVVTTRRSPTAGNAESASSTLHASSLQIDEDDESEEGSTVSHNKIKLFPTENMTEKSATANPRTEASLSSETYKGFVTAHIPNPNPVMVLEATMKFKFRNES